MGLLSLPGYELGLLAALLSVPAGLLLGIGAARRARTGPAPSALRAALRAALPLALGQLGLFALAAAFTALFTPCRSGAAAGLYWLTALPSALLAAALGAACGFAARRLLVALGLAALGLLGSLATTAARAYSGPSAAAFDHLLGFWPGPIYDEALAVDGRLLLFRAGTLAWAGALVALATLVLRRRERHPVGPSAAATALALAAALAARAAGGIDPSRDAVAEALGGSRSGDRCALRFPREWSPAQAERLLRDCEEAAAEVSRRLAIGQPPRVAVFVYRSPDEKRLLVGAGRTSFTKPWLAEVHVNDEPGPRPVLRHELVHALASAFAEGPLKVPARAGLIVRAGLVEGLAAALEAPVGEYTAHEWARGLRDLGLLPPAEALLGDGAFLGAAPARAYGAAGSFLAFLLERHGPARVQALYRSGDPAAALGVPLPELALAWGRFLDGLPVPEGLAAAAELRFREPSLFARACGREQAALAQRARQAARVGDAAGAEVALRRVALLSGKDPAPLREAAEAWRRSDPARAAALAAEALARAEDGGGQRELRGALVGLLGDLALQGDDAAAAAARYRQALALAGAESERRSLQAKLAAALDPSLAAAVAPWLLGAGDPGLALARLAGSEAPLPRYLLARAHLARGGPRRALGLLRGLAVARLPGELFAAETARLEAEALCAAGDFRAGGAAWERIGARASREAERERARDSARRCAFEEREYGAAIAWPGDGP